MKMKKLTGEIASQPTIVTLNSICSDVMVFVLIKVDNVYKKLFYRDRVPCDLFSNILVSSVGDKVSVEVTSTSYHGATEIKRFVNHTRGLGVVTI